MYVVEGVLLGGDKRGGLTFLEGASLDKNAVLNGEGLGVEWGLFCRDGAIERVTDFHLGCGTGDGYRHWGIETVAALADGWDFDNAGGYLGVGNVAEQTNGRRCMVN